LLSFGGRGRSTHPTKPRALNLIALRRYQTRARNI
jgi:hypothetical protein